MPGLWKNKSETKEGKYLVQRRDGTIPEYPVFVIGARDPCAYEALIAYAAEAGRIGLDHEYISDIRDLAKEFKDYSAVQKGNPDATPHRTDDPTTIQKMKYGNSA